MTNREETAVVKTALRKAGVPFSRVRHGTGTSSWWLYVYLEGGENEDRRVLQIVQKVTGRLGPYDGRIRVMGE